jgi:hypothetical protein
MTASGHIGQLPLPISLDEGATFENFYAGPNQSAVEALTLLAGYLSTHVPGGFTRPGGGGKPG